MSDCSGWINRFISRTEIEKKRLKERRGLKRQYFIEFVIYVLDVTLYLDIVLYTLDTQNNIHIEECKMCEAR